MLQLICKTKADNKQYKIENTQENTCVFFYKKILEIAIIIAIIFIDMKKKFLILFISCFIGFANGETFTTNAKSAYLIDYDSGTSIVSKNADVLMPPSSMLKLMTLAVVFDEIKSGKLKMSDKITASKNVDYKNPLWYSASKLCLINGQKITVQDAILGSIVLSAGDATVALAEKIAGSEQKFTENMLAKAREIGMEQSTFGNASGLPNPNNLMTSKELAMLARYIISEYPDIYPLFATKRFEFEDTKTDWCNDWAKGHTMTYNKLLFSMYGADGLKTGHTNEGGYGMVASAKIKGRRLIAVINGFKAKGHDALAEEVKKLLTYGYKNTKTKIFYRAGDKLTEVPVWYGKEPFVEATVDSNVAITVDVNSDLKNIRVLARYDQPVKAPVKAGQKIGEVIIEKNGDVINRIPLVAKNNVRKIQFLGRIIKNISVLIWGK